MQKIEPIRSLNNLFESRQIRIAGTVERPLFVAVDLADVIEDLNYSRTFKQYNARYKEKLRYTDKKGEERELLMLTEVGAYKYLLSSKRPKAEAFQHWVENQLVTLRREGVVRLEREIKASELFRKIAEDEVRLLQTKVRILEAGRPDAYHRSEDSVPADLLDYCIRRYYGKQQERREDDATPALWSLLTGEVAHFFKLGYYERAYDVVEEALDKYYEERGGSVDEESSSDDPQQSQKPETKVLGEASEARNRATVQAPLVFPQALTNEDLDSILSNI